MAQTDKDKLMDLINKLNQYRHEYYDLKAPSVSDEVYDRFFDELVRMQSETNIYMANSPTMGAGYPPVSKLEKVNHPIPLLSLDEVNDYADLVAFQKQKQLMLMLKLDGLTVKLTYENYELVEASTRGYGDVGEIITHNVCSIAGIPILINHKERLVVIGEVFVCPSDFEKLKMKLMDSEGKPYKSVRDLAAGSVCQFDPAQCREGCVKFQVFNVLEGFDNIPVKSKRLGMLPAFGFDVCKFLVTNRPLTQPQMEIGIRQLQDYAKENDIPIDGVVVTYNDVAYSKSCGRTDNSYKDSIAYVSSDTQKLKKFVHFVSKNGMNIEGLEDGTLEKLICKGLLQSLTDIFCLDRYREQIISMDGFSEKSWQSLWNAIQASRNTTFEQFLISMDITRLGKDASRTLANVFGSSLDAFVEAVCCGYDFTRLPNFSETLHNNIHAWFSREENFCLWYEMQDLVTIREPAVFYSMEKVA